MFHSLFNWKLKLHGRDGLVCCFQRHACNDGSVTRCVLMRTPIQTSLIGHFDFAAPFMLNQDFYIWPLATWLFLLVTADLGKSDNNHPNESNLLLIPVHWPWFGSMDGESLNTSQCAVSLSVWETWDTACVFPASGRPCSGFISLCWHIRVLLLHLWPLGYCYLKP